MKRGSVIVGIVMLLTGLMTISVALTSAVLSSSIKVQRQYKKLNALAYAEAGVNRGLWEINSGNINYGQTPTVDSSLAGGEFEVATVSCGADCKYITSTGYLPSKEKSVATRTVRVKINGVQSNTSLSFKFGIQAGYWGAEVENNAQIKGSIFAEGPIDLNHSNAKVAGSVTSYGSTPTTSYIKGGTISGDARAYTISNSVVKGTKYSGVYPTVQPMPINEIDLPTTIDGWENAAETGGTIGNSLSISGNNNTLGPKKIDGDLIITNNAKLMITGTLWVTGNLIVNNGAVIYLSPTYGVNSGLIVVDHKIDREDTSKGKVSIGQGVTVSGIDQYNPKTPSNIMIFSTNKPLYGDWDSYEAIDVNQNVLGGIYYAPYGGCQLEQNSQVRAIVCMGVEATENAIVDYDSGMANSTFAGGPAGKWTITEWLILN